jgi:hypothetical protein
MDKFTPLTQDQLREVYGLLCIIHQDGGQTIDAFGMDEAIKRAKDKVIKERSRHLELLRDHSSLAMAVED